MSTNSESRNRTEPWEREAFSYDPEADLLYRQYCEQYQKLGRQAMEDTVGQTAGLTGGYGNSYGETAGMQAYNRYLGKLNELLPELYDAKRTEYDKETDALYRSLSLEEKQRENAFDRCMELLGSGIRPSDEELSAAGVSAEQAATALAVFQVQTGYHSGSGSSGSSGGSGGSGATSGTGNGSLTAEQIMELQKFLGVTVDGDYGPVTQAAAQSYFGTAGMSAIQAWIAYQKAIGAFGGGNGGIGNPNTEQPN